MIIGVELSGSLIQNFYCQMFSEFSNFQMTFLNFGFVETRLWYHTAIHVLKIVLKIKT